MIYPMEPYWFSPEQIQLVEEKYNATYIGPFARAQNNGWTEIPVDTFYQPNPQPGHKKYFGLFRHHRNGAVMITNQSKAMKHEYSGVRANDGEVLFSRWIHDFRTSQDGSVSVDGGQYYTRILWNGEPPQQVIVRMVDGQWIVNEDNSH